MHVEQCCRIQASFATRRLLMKLSRFTSAPRLVWTTLLLTSLSLALSPELFAEDPLAQSSQSPTEPSAHQSEDSFAEFVTKRWEDEDEEDEIVPIQRKKHPEELRGPRFGFCVGLDFTCVLGGFKTGYSWERGTLLVQLPFRLHCAYASTGCHNGSCGKSLACSRILGSCMTA